MGRYAIAALDDGDVTGRIEAFDELRQLRNQSQYDGLAVERDEVLELLGHADAIVRAIGEDLNL